MGALLAFFGGSALRLKALVIAALAMAAVCGALTAWALLERSSRLSCEVDKVALEGEVRVLEGQLKVMADKITTQNTAIDGWKRAADEAAGKGDLARAAATQAAAKLQPNIVRLEKAVKDAAGAAKRVDCNDAVAEIRKGLKR